LLVGDGPTAAECRVLAGRLGIADRVRFAGRLPYSEVPAAIAAADIAVVPASNEYGDSMKLRDYMAVRRPVLAPRPDTMARVVAHDRPGLLFERDSVPALAAALARLSADPELRKRLGRLAAVEAAECSWRRRAGQLLAAIEDLRPPVARR